MKFIEFDSDKCDECFKCLRVCPTKAIAFVNNKRHIIDDLCIKCGLCLTHCEQKALSIHQDIQRVKNAILAGKKVIVSIAPSYAGLFEMKNPSQMATALRLIGFEYVEETARGAEIVSKRYEKIIESNKMKNIITSCCPSSNYYIENYFPKLIDYVIPVVSPMIAHGKYLKDRYGDDAYTVFIGPCVAKKAEAKEIDNAIDAVITFRELEIWFKEREIILKDLESSGFDAPVDKRSKAYPVGGSLWNKDMKTRVNSNYKYVHINGIEACKEFLKAIENGDIEGYCAEVNICLGSCLNGPEIPLTAPNIFKRISNLNNYVDEKNPENCLLTEVNNHILTDRIFTDKSINKIPVNEDHVASVLLDMGKYSQRDQINCGACGYSTCYDKAVAVTMGYSDMELCLDRLKHKVESLQNTIFDNSPNLICILDEELRIQDTNAAFNEIFNKEKTKLKEWPISTVINTEIFEEINTPLTAKISRKCYIESVNRTFYVNLIKIHDGVVFVGIFTDITDAENNREELMRVKERTIETCQEVINNQMRVAQEIASLLGETTAETKLGLNKLKEIVLSEGDY
ncbi:[Fe-Fe] hydrogenase large subunit C-terminal domain-containing protein [Clostridiaceae bacterium HSG29]|nr:[Fe-Fe] hydrogenase large subunit C-terminal domain-containing protein [Clostridiaceae bacterium HSG29]